VLKIKALILNSGEGKRLLPLTKYKPKALIKIGNNTLLGYQINNLIKCNIRSVIITTGPFEDKIRGFVRKNYPNINVLFIKNPEYKNTNYIYSMWLTKNYIDDDIILLHGDLLFEKKLLEKLIHSKYPNCVLVNKKIKPPEKDFKAKIKNNKVVKISVELFGEDAFFCAPLYKFSKMDFLYWLNEIEKSVKVGNLKIYAEDVFNNISDRIVLRPVYFTKELCMEIDTKEDLEVAEDLLLKRRRET
jgi:phosphoenolpyruvate phosphomutase